MLPLTPWSQFSRAGGSRTLIAPLKRRGLCRLSYDPTGRCVPNVSDEPTEPCWPPQVVRGGIAPASGDVSDRHAAVTTPDRPPVGQEALESSSPAFQAGAN